MKRFNARYSAPHLAQPHLLPRAARLIHRLHNFQRLISLFTQDQRLASSSCRLTEYVKMLALIANQKL